MLQGLSAFAALSDETGLKATGKEANIIRQTDIPTLVGGTIRRFGGLIGTLFLALLIYGGIIWMTAQGSDEKIKKAKAIITSAVIGLVVTVAAYSISEYVIGLAATATLGDQLP